MKMIKRLLQKLFCQHDWKEGVWLRRSIKDAKKTPFGCSKCGSIKGVESCN
jgi:hypothetical protein